MTGQTLFHKYEPTHMHTGTQLLIHALSSVPTHELNRTHKNTGNGCVWILGVTCWLLECHSDIHLCW